MAQDELAILIAAGQRAGIAIDTQNRAGNFGAGLAQNQPPGFFTFGTRDANQIPLTGDGRRSDIGFRLGSNRCVA